MVYENALSVATCPMGHSRFLLFEIMRKRKVYGVSSLVEHKAIIKAGGVRLHVHFKGGAMTDFGVTPAKYATDNALYQSMIESSEEFKGGRIFLISEYEVEGECEIYPMSGGDEPTSPVEDEPTSPVEDEPTSPVEDVSEEKGSDGSEEEEEMKFQKTFSSLADARDFLSEEYKVEKSSIKSKETAIRAGESVGVKIIFEKQ